MFRRALEWFGLGESDEYDDDEYGDEYDDEPQRTQVRSRGGGRSGARAASSIGDDLYAERPNVRRLDRPRAGMGDDFDDIWSGPPGASRAASGAPRGGNGSRGGGDAGRTSVLRPVESSRPPKVRVHLIVPQGFNDAQQIADRFKDPSPVILNMQTIETELAKRLIDFASGLTYALDGGMQRVADRVFLLTPPNVSVSAEEREQLADGFFNQS